MSTENKRRFLLESWLEFRRTLEDHPQLKRALFDPVTGLPTAPLLFPRFETLLAERHEVSLLCLNVVKYGRIEEVHGWQVFDEVMRQSAYALEAIAGTDLRDSDVIAELMSSGNCFVIVLAPPRDADHMNPEDLQRIAERVEARMREILHEQLDPSLYQSVGFYVGRSTFAQDETVPLEALVFDGIAAALADANGREAVDAAERGKRLREIVANEEIRTLVHPIFHLEDSSVIGYEVLSRGPEGTEFERPDMLFRVAYDEDLCLELERLCRRKALSGARGVPEGRLLFLNIEPDTVSDPDLRNMTFSSLLSDLELSPESIVLELSERAAVADFGPFRGALQLLRALGFGVAVDDAGGGHGSLQCIAEVHPEWLKLNMSLVRGVDSDPVRQRLVESLVTFATKAGARLIAVGIETPAELAALKHLGVGYGQGFLFCQPLEPFPEDEFLETFLDA